MPTLSLVKPVENVASLAEAKVLALLEHLMPTLEKWRQGEDLRQERTNLTTELDELLPQVTKLQSRQAEVSKLVEETTAALKKMKMLAIGIAAVAVAAIAFVSIYALALALAAIWPAMQMSKAGTSLKDAIEKRTEVESELAKKSLRAQACRDRLAQIESDLGGRADSFPEVSLAEVQFKLQTKNLAGAQLLIDASTAHQATRLKTLDVTPVSGALPELERKAHQLTHIPPLLSPGDVAGVDDPLNQLYGEESTLQGLVSEFTGNLGKLRDVQVTVPLVPNESLLAKRLAAKAAFPSDMKSPLLLGKNVDGPEFQAFTDAFNEHRRTGHALVEQLRAVYDQLETTATRFATARITSVNTVHDSLAQVLNRASWCNRKFFCPRTIVSPKYIQDLLGIDIDNAYRMDLDDLLDRLQSDEVVRTRIGKKPELIDQLSAIHQSIEDFTQMSSGFDEGGQALRPSGNRKHAQQQLQEYAKQFKSTLNKILTGASFPVLNFSAEAQLYFDPDVDEWSSDLNPYVYRTPDVLKYGSVIKTHHELMIPLWEHLWTEKADFRKSELFRTNESMIAMSEKESEKLIEIGNQFRGDMRGNRENIYMIESDLKSKHTEILSFRDGLHKLGVLSERAMRQLSDERLGSLVVDESPLNVAHRYEATLAALPQAQAEARGTAADPIDMVRNPAVLLGFEASEAPRLIGR